MCWGLRSGTTLTDYAVLKFLAGAVKFIGLSSEKIYGDAHRKTGKVSNLVNWPIPWNEPPRIGKFFECISGVRIKSCGMDTPRIWHLVESFEILLLHVLSNDACKFAINLHPISWGPFENVNFLYFLLKMQIWNGCNALNIVGYPIKDINVNLIFSVQDQKLWNRPPQGLEIILSAFLGSG